MRLKLKLVQDLNTEPHHLLHIPIKTGLRFFTWLKQKRTGILIFAPKDQKFIIQYKCKI
jgi:hypothetical protein